MTAIVTNNFRFQNLLTNKKKIDELKDLYYLQIGRAAAWDSDSTPPIPDITQIDELGARLATQGAKRISDVAICAPRWNWLTGSTYVAYDDRNGDLVDTAYYVLNPSNFNVYICLKAGAGTSTVEPTGIDDNPTYGGTLTVAGSMAPTALADGYIWKYLYTIDAPTAAKFLTNDFIPVLRNASVADNAVQGAIYRIKVETPGSGYAGTPTVAVIGDGAGATATATVSGGVITSINITAPGSGYTTARIEISGGTPAVAGTARAIVSPQSYGREIDSITVSSGGTGYTNGAMALNITGDGFDATVTATVTGGVIQAAPVIDTPGYGYSYAQIEPAGDTAGTAAEFIVNYSSAVGGFGYDPIIDLNAYYMMYNVVLTGDEGGDFIPANDYRQLMIVKNPLDLASPQKAFTATTGILLSYLVVQSGGTWLNDDIITGGTSSAKGIVNYYDPTEERVYFSQSEETGFGTFVDGETLTGAGVSTGNVAAAAGSADHPPELDRFSGQALYLENRVPVSRAADQTEDIKVVIQW